PERWNQGASRHGWTTLDSAPRPPKPQVAGSIPVPPALETSNLSGFGHLHPKPLKHLLTSGSKTGSKPVRHFLGGTDVTDQKQIDILLHDGTATWNLWRAERSIIRRNLREAQLRDANLQGADLHNADLTGAILAGANLNQADLRDANLAGVDLTKADLQESD